MAELDAINGIVNMPWRSRDLRVVTVSAASRHAITGNDKILGEMP
jgi:hypothetical protein